MLLRFCYRPVGLGTLLYMVLIVPVLDVIFTYWIDLRLLLNGHINFHDPGKINPGMILLMQLTIIPFHLLRRIRSLS